MSGAASQPFTCKETLHLEMTIACRIAIFCSSYIFVCTLFGNQAVMLSDCTQLSLYMTHKEHLHIQRLMTAAVLGAAACSVVLSSSRRASQLVPVLPSRAPGSMVDTKP